MVLYIISAQLFQSQVERDSVWSGGIVVNVRVTCNWHQSDCEMCNVGGHITVCY